MESLQEQAEKIEIPIINKESLCYASPLGKKNLESLRKKEIQILEKTPPEPSAPKPALNLKH